MRGSVGGAALVGVVHDRGQKLPCLCFFVLGMSPHLRGTSLVLKIKGWFLYRYLCHLWCGRSVLCRQHDVGRKFFYPMRCKHGLLNHVGFSHYQRRLISRPEAFSCSARISLAGPCYVSDRLCDMKCNMLVRQQQGHQGSV